MVICGADALAHRLAFELAGRYGQQIVVLTPSLRDGHGPRIAALGTRRGLPVTVVEAPELRWNPDPDRLLADGDRVVVATTREGLGHLATGTVGPGPARAPDDGPADPGPSAGARRSSLPRPAGPAS